MVNHNVNTTTRAVANITIVSYVLLPQAFLTSIQFAGPALDMGVERLRSLYNFNVSHRYIGSYNWSTYQGMVDNMYLVSKFYYDEWDGNGLFTLIAPGADETFGLAMLSREWDIPIFTPTITDPVFANKKLYPTVVSLSPMAVFNFLETIAAVLDRFAWTSVYVISDEGGPSPFYQLWIPAAKVFLARRPRGPKVSLTVITGNTVRQGTDWFRSALQEIIKYSRVVILSMNGYRARDFLIAAALSGMTNGEYVYLTLEPYEVPRLVGILAYNQIGDTANNNQIAMEAFRSLFKIEACKNLPINSSTYREKERLITEFTRRSHDVYNFTYPLGEKPNVFVLATYESVAILGQLVNESLNLNLPLLGQTMATMSRNRTFMLDTGEIRVDPVGERSMNFCVSDFDVVSRKMKPVLLYFPSSRQLLNISEIPIDWANPQNTPPFNEPLCGFLGTNKACNKGRSDPTIAIAASATAGTVIALGLSLVVVTIYRIQAQLRDLTLHRCYIAENELKKPLLSKIKMSRAAFGRQP